MAYSVTFHPTTVPTVNGLPGNSPPVNSSSGNNSPVNNSWDKNLRANGRLTLIDATIVWPLIEIALRA
jgi:hypothetical protein